MQNPPRRLLVLFLLLWSTAWPYVGRAALRFRVWAQPRFTALDVAPGQGSGLRVRGRLLDDAGNPVEDAPIQVRRRGTTRALPTQSCSGVAAQTDADGGFCAILPKGAEPADFELWFAGASHYEPASALLPSVAWRGELTLQFTSSTLEMDIEAPEPTVALRIESGQHSSSALSGGLQLVVEARFRDRFVQLGATQLTSQAGALSVSLDTRELPTPGAYELVAYARGPDAPAARAHAVLLLTATVHLEEKARLQRDQTTQVELVATSARGTPAGSLQVTGSGWERSVPLVSGQASVTLPSSAPKQDTFEARFVPAGPWWIPGPPLELSAYTTESPGSPLWPWLVVLLGVGYACFRALERPTRRHQPEQRGPAARPAGEIVWEAAPELRGWRGVVYDSHERTGIADATVALRGPAIGGAVLLASTRSNALGEYDLPLAIPPPEGSCLEVFVSGYARLRIAAPPFGRLRVPMTHARRDLLERLAQLARHTHSASAERPEPTPADLARQAKRYGRGSIAGWAEAVERAAYAEEPLAEAHYHSLIEETPQQRSPGDSGSDAATTSTTNR